MTSNVGTNDCRSIRTKIDNLKFENSQLRVYGLFGRKIKGTTAVFTPRRHVSKDAVWRSTFRVKPKAQHLTRCLFHCRKYRRIKYTKGSKANKSIYDLSNIFYKLKDHLILPNKYQTVHRFSPLKALQWRNVCGHQDACANASLTVLHGIGATRHTDFLSPPPKPLSNHNFLWHQTVWQLTLDSSSLTDEMRYGVNDFFDFFGDRVRRRLRSWTKVCPWARLQLALHACTDRLPI